MVKTQGISAAGPDGARQARSNAAFAAVPLSPFLLIGAFSLVYGGAQAIQHRSFLHRAVPATGTVVGIVKGTSRRTYPLVRYRTPNGESVQFKSRVSSSAYTVGQHVGVVYDPADTGTAEIDSPDSWYSVLMLPLFGAILWAFCLACLLAVYVVSRRANAARAG
jgi:hypothetical protein